jgi:Domain of unknown function (DUF4157)
MSATRLHERRATSAASRTRRRSPEVFGRLVPGEPLLASSHSPRWEEHICVQRNSAENNGVHETEQSNAAARQSVLEMLQSDGEPLERLARANMEARFGQDFSQVRVHADGRAAASANAIHANAYTVRDHVAFASGQYAPGTEAGRRLLSHELTHVVQQRSAGAIGIQGGDFAVSEPSDAAEQTAERISSGQTDARAAIGSAVSIAGPMVQRQRAKPTHTPAPAATPAERQLTADEAWLFAENRLVTELETRYEELIRLAAFQTKTQIKDFFDPYDDDIKADAPFSTVLNIAGAGAGNVPNDPSSIQRVPAGSPPGTPGGPIPQTFSVSGGIAGLVSGSIGPLVSLILDTSRVGEVREKLDTKVEQFLVEGLTTSSPTFSSFETQARSEMQQYFLSRWSDRDQPHTAAGLTSLINQTAQHARASYGASSTLGTQIVEAVRTYVKGQLDLIQPELDRLERKHRNARLGAFALGGALAGGLLGGALGFGLGGGGGLVAGAAAGLIGGGLVGLLAGGITNSLTPSAADVRRKRAQEAAEEEERRKRHAPDILEPQYRPRPQTEVA